MPKRKHEPAPLLGPQTEDEWYIATMQAIRKSAPSEETKQEYRKVLERFPAVAQRFGDLPTLYRAATSDRFAKQAVIEEAVKFQTKALRAQLAGDEATPLESLLVDAILACHQDYWMFAMVYEQKTGSSFTLRDLEQWERVLASKEARYLRAVETLARVRRLLKINVQVNIATEGGQQVNVQQG